MLPRILGLTERALTAPTAEAASLGFHAALQPLGATYLQTRNYRRPQGTLDSARHWQAGGWVARVARDGWVGSPAFDYICFECNPLVDAIRGGLTRYRFSDFAPHGDPRYVEYWKAFQQADIADGLCATSYGHDGRIASLHLGFDRKEFEPGEAEAIQMAGLILTERILELSPAPARASPDHAPLTGRELDALRYVAEGKSDWEIGAILTVSEHTARFHVDNARRKLGAVTRAQAVARLAALGRL